MENKPKLDGAILQRDKTTYAIVPRTPMGMLTPDFLESLLEVVKKWDIPIIKITSGQRIALVGIPEGKVDDVWDDLGRNIGRATELCVHYVQACPGTAVCRLGVQDSLGLGGELEEQFLGQDYPAKVKIAVSGCPMCCAESKLRDIGIVGTKKGYDVYFGGNAGNKARIADQIASELSREEATEVSRNLLDYYKKNAKKRERTARFCERLGIDAIKEAIL